MKLSALTILKLALLIIAAVSGSLLLLLITGFIPRGTTLLVLAAWIVFLAVMIAIGVRSGRLSFYSDRTKRRN